MVTHPTTNTAKCCLTSEILRDQMYPTLHGPKIFSTKNGPKIFSDPKNFQHNNFFDQNILILKHCLTKNISTKNCQPKKLNAPKKCWLQIFFDTINSFIQKNVWHKNFVLDILHDLIRDVVLNVDLDVVLYVIVELMIYRWINNNTKMCAFSRQI